MSTHVVQLHTVGRDGVRVLGVYGPIPEAEARRRAGEVERLGSRIRHRGPVSARVLELGDIGTLMDHAAEEAVRDYGRRLRRLLRRPGPGRGSGGGDR